MKYGILNQSKQHIHLTIRMNLSITSCLWSLLSLPDFLDGPLDPRHAAEAFPGGAVLLPARRPARRDLVEAGVEVVGVQDRQLVARRHRRQSSTSGREGEQRGRPRHTTL